MEREDVDEKAGTPLRIMRWDNNIGLHASSKEVKRAEKILSLRRRKKDNNVTLNVT